MNKSEIAINSERFAMWYRKNPLTVEEFKKIEPNLTKECRKYLIGIMSERERMNRKPEETFEMLHMRFGKNFGYTGPSLKNVIEYSRAVENLYKVAPDIAIDIIKGEIRLSYKSTIRLAKLSKRVIYAMVDEIKSGRMPDALIPGNKLPKRRGRPEGKRKIASKVSVKDAPPHDPDAQIVALKFTIPSWVNMIDKAFMNTNFDEVSQVACDELQDELITLKITVKAMLGTLLKKESS